MKKHEVTVKCKMETDAVVSLLSDLVNSFREGKVVVQKGDSFITLKPAGPIEMELEATEKKGKQKIEIQLSWKEEAPPEAEPDDEICICATEPAIEDAEAVQCQPDTDSILYRKW